MAKKTPKTPPPNSLTMDLYAPGMSLIHRAGMGGLAASLRWIEACAEQGEIPSKRLPGGKWKDGEPPWKIEATRITLKFGKPESAGEFLQRVFELSFQIRKDGLIYLPGQFDTEPKAEVLAEVQNGLTLSFIRHGKTRKLDKTPTVHQYEASGDGTKMVSVEYKKCSWFKHQDGWDVLTDKQSCLVTNPIEVIGPLCPGAVVRHVAFTTSTKIAEPVDRVLPLYFSIVGCLVLPINRGVGALVIPEVSDLEDFAVLRAEMSPHSGRQCRIAGATDAALQAQIRVWAAKKSRSGQVPGCHAVTFRPTSWASQQKSRVDAFLVPASDARLLRQFEIALDTLKPHVATTVAPKKKADARPAKKKKAAKKPSGNDAEYFWSDSIVRPLIADNLARQWPWYKGFADLMTKVDTVSKQHKRLKLFFEKEGLHAMTESIPWQDEGESTIVRAVHQALKQRLGAIAGENKGNAGGMKNRMRGEFDKWRLAFAGAKTEDQFRHALCDLFGRAGVNPVLREKWETILPWLSHPQKWQLARDLSLLAIASYKGTGEKELEQETPVKD